MLQLCNIVKDYTVGDSVVHALKGVNIVFRKNEFVSILGHSGCGKTTLLNIVGGLDKYTSGDLIINGISTKEYKDRDWDNYRNHSIGFVFQSYNLIPHQTVLGNVELALTLSGVSPSERKIMAKKALEKVGLGDQLNKRPNQLSGGQMQRVAIARALVNNPDIILADEPTGALDTETSVQIMELLKEVAQDKLVIMVTHNPDLSESYSTRIIKLKDGEIIADNMPYSVEDAEKDAQLEVAEEEKVSDTEPPKKKKRKKKRDKKPSMSFLTALALSIKNLLTKKGRTFLVSFAGSIGIIGIALILSLSNGFKGYIDSIERGTMSSYPLSITESTLSFDILMEAMNSDDSDMKPYPDDKNVYSNDLLANLMGKFVSSVSTNDLASFKTWIDDNPNKFEGLLNGIQYTYNTNFCIYQSDYNEKTPTQLYPYKVPEYITNPIVGGGADEASGFFEGMMNGISIWQEMLDNQELLNEQYEPIAGSWPKKYEASDNRVFEVVLSVDKYNRISDYLLCAIGLENIDTLWSNVLLNKDTSMDFSFDDLIGRTYNIMLGANKFIEKDGKWINNEKDKNYIRNQLDNGITIKIAGIVRPKANTSSALLSGAICYTHELTDYIIEHTGDCAIIAAQKADESVALTIDAEGFENCRTVSDVYKLLGYTDKSTPSGIFFYPVGFDQKEKLKTVIKEYNNSVEKPQQIKYSDTVAALMGSVSTIINAVTYVLIAFVSISLIVSSIMIGIITYISVLERTKEIGVLRSIGASKHDISRLFNAETLTIGLMSGVFGIVITLLLDIPINLIITSLTGLTGIAMLPLWGALSLVGISMLLTLIAGFVPSKIAAKKDPVVALRTE